MSDISYGLWTGTAVNDTSSVVAAGYAFSEAAGDFATMVKLTRTLSIIPIVVIFALIQIRTVRKNIKGKSSSTKNVNLNMGQVFPWFILGFVVMAVFNSIGWIPEEVSLILKDISKFLMVIALAAVGLKTDLTKLRESGFAPLTHGFLISVLVVVVSFVVQIFLGIV